MRLIPLLLAALIAGCAGTAVADDPSPEGRTFVSVSVQGEQVPGGGPLTLSFADGQLSGHAGCNRVSGPVDLAGGHLSTRLSTTMMGCPPPFGDADTWMARLLETRPTWSLSGDTLTLSTDYATVILHDKSVVDPDLPLIGTTWRVDTLLSKPAAVTSVLLEQAGPTLMINADRTVTGWTGCNTFYGRAEVAELTVNFAPVITSGPVCEGELGDIERFIVRVLNGPVGVGIDADRLTLSSARGDGLVLRAQ